MLHLRSLNLIAITAVLPWSMAFVMPTLTSLAISNMTVPTQAVHEAFVSGGIMQPKQMAFFYTTWYPPLNTPDHMRVGSTTTITSGTSTITETPTSTTDAPWDITTATADADGVAKGDYVFPLSDSGKETLSSIFSDIEAVCGLPVRRRDEHSQLRRDGNPAECARDFLAESEVAAWDVGIDISIGTIAAGDVAVAVEAVPAAVAVALGAWIFGGGKVSDNQSITISSAAITKVDESLVKVGEEEEEDDEIEDVPSQGHSYFVASDEDAVKMAQSIGAWQRAEPWAARRLSRVPVLRSAMCQESPFYAPLNTVDGQEVDASRAALEFCEQKAGQELTSDAPSQYTRYDLTDHSFWVTAAIFDEHESTHCDYNFVDIAECTEIVRFAMTSCANDDGSETTGGEAYGECLKYVITIDPSMTNTEPPSWEDANGGELGQLADEFVNNCLDENSRFENDVAATKFTYEEAKAAVQDFCGHSEDQLKLPDAAEPIFKTYPVDGANLQLVMQWAQSGQQSCHQPQTWTNQVSQEACSSQFMAAINNCNQDTTTEKYGNKPMTWNSVMGCIDFMVYADPEDWTCEHLGFAELQCTGNGVQLD